jgi:N-methylhydantoinase B
MIVNPGTKDEVDRSGQVNFLQAGDVLANNTGGGGGYGHPFERDPKRVSTDARNGFVSVVAAARDYGVVLDASTFIVDAEATARAREVHRSTSLLNS